MFKGLGTLRAILGPYSQPSGWSDKTRKLVKKQSHKKLRNFIKKITRKSVEEVR